MLERYVGARLAVATETPCCSYAVRLQQKKLMDAIMYAQKSFSVGSPAIKSLYMFKATEKLQEVALQDIYPKGRKYALLLLNALNASAGFTFE